MEIEDKDVGIVAVVGIVVVALLIALNSSGSDVSPGEINTSKVSSFLEERTGYSDCMVERNYNGSEADATCTRDIGEQSNMSFKSGERFTAELRNGSIVVFSDYNY